MASIRCRGNIGFWVHVYTINQFLPQLWMLVLACSNSCVEGRLNCCPIGPARVVVGGWVGFWQHLKIIIYPPEDDGILHKR